MSETLCWHCEKPGTGRCSWDENLSAVRAAGTAWGLLKFIHKGGGDVIPFSKCCEGCVPPRRRFDCHFDCPDYLEAKAEHEAKAAEDARRRHQERDADAAAYKLKRR